eukprot:2412450-Pleurochrysis_carterae.AAC.1
MNFLLARVIASLQSPRHVARSEQPYHSAASTRHSGVRSVPTHGPTAPAVDTETTPLPPEREHFRRGLGAYPLRSREPAALLITRPTPARRLYGRGTGCTYTTAAPTADPKTRKQALAEC